MSENRPRVEMQVADVTATNADGTVDIVLADGETLAAVDVVGATPAVGQHVPVFAHDYTLHVIGGGAGGAGTVGQRGPEGPRGPQGPAGPAGGLDPHTHLSHITPVMDNPRGQFLGAEWQLAGAGVSMYENQRCLVTVGGIVTAGRGQGAVSFQVTNSGGVALSPDNARSVWAGVNGALPASSDPVLLSLEVCVQKTFMVWTVGVAGTWTFQVAARTRNGLATVRDPWIIVESFGDTP